MKTVKAGKVLLILLILIALNGCAGKDKTKEIVWYIEQGSESWKHIKQYLMRELMLLMND